MIHSLNKMLRETHDKSGTAHNCLKFHINEPRKEFSCQEVKDPSVFQSAWQGGIPARMYKA